MEAWKLYLFYSAFAVCVIICISCIFAELRQSNRIKKSFCSIKSTLDKSIELLNEQNKQLDRMIDFYKTTKGK